MFGHMCGGLFNFPENQMIWRNNSITNIFNINENSQRIFFRKKSFSIYFQRFPYRDIETRKNEVIDCDWDFGQIFEIAITDLIAYEKIFQKRTLKKKGNKWTHGNQKCPHVAGQMREYY
jgi:hypothetical protein